MLALQRGELSAAHDEQEHCTRNAAYGHTGNRIGGPNSSLSATETTRLAITLIAAFPPMPSPKTPY
jgi:hypothetical protein